MKRDDIGPHEAYWVSDQVWHALEAHIFRKAGKPRFKVNFTASLLKVDYQGHASVTPTFAEKASSGPGESPVVRLGWLQLRLQDQ